MEPVLRRLTRIVIGYCVSAFASGACVLGGASILAVVQRAMTGSGELAPLTHSAVSLVFLSIMLMILGALPALAVGLIAESLKIRHWLYYVLGGMLICMVMWRGLPFQGTGDFQFFLFAGALGGAVYWRIAGRKAGEWTHDPVPDVESVTEPDEGTWSNEPSDPPETNQGPAQEHSSPAQRPESWIRSR